MNNIDRLKELSGQPVSHTLVEYKNGGLLDKILVVCNPVSSAESIDDCMKQVTPKELFLMAADADVEQLNPTFYYPTATGVAKKDAKARFETMQLALDKRSEADELSKAAEEAASDAENAERAAGIMTNDEEAIDIDTTGDLDDQPEDADALPNQAEEDEELHTDVKTIENVKESIGEDNSKLDSAFAAKSESTPNQVPEDQMSNQNGAKLPSEDYDDVDKVDVPADVIKDLKGVIKDATMKAEHYANNSASASSFNDAQRNYKIAECGSFILDLLEAGNRLDYDKAVHYFTTLMSPIQLELPTSLKKYLVYGGKTGRSLKDYYIDARG